MVVDYKELYGENLAIFGASTNPKRISHKAIIGFKAEGYNLILIHPTAEEILGLRVYKKLQDYEGTVDLAFVYMNPVTALRAELVTQLQDKDVKTAILQLGDLVKQEHVDAAPVLMQQFQTADIETRIICPIVEGLDKTTDQIQ